MPEVDYFDYFENLNLCIDYFSKWPEPRCNKDKSAPAVPNFLYEIICGHDTNK